MKVLLKLNLLESKINEKNPNSRGEDSGAFTVPKGFKKLKPNSFEIELISNNNYFIFQPLLPEVASGTIPAGDAVTPIRQMLPKM